MDVRPLNALETAINEARTGLRPMQEAIGAFMIADIAVPSGEDPSSGAGMLPLVFQGDDGPMMACFSDMNRIGIHAQMAPFCLVMKGEDLVARMPPQLGLVINPGLDWGFQLAPQGVQQLRDEAAKAAAAAKPAQP